MTTTPPTTTSAAEPLAPLYTEEWISLAAFGIANVRISNMERLDIAKELFRQVIDKYEVERQRLRARIDELEADNRELSSMVSLEFEQAMKGSKND